MDVSLQEWVNANQPSDEMCWKEPFWNQVMFMRDRVASLFARNYEQFKNMVRVVSTHTSKSIKCPVYYIQLDEGVKIWARHNFFNWNISVDARASGRDIDCDFLGVADDRNYDYCFCEGMEEQKFDPREKDKRRFTVEVNDHYEAYVFFRAIKQLFGILPETKNNVTHQL